VVAVVGALVHVYLINESPDLGSYVGTLWKQLLWGLMPAAFIALLGWARVIKPLGQRGAERAARTGRPR
jgi:hypothetical protein